MGMVVLPCKYNLLVYLCDDVIFCYLWKCFPSHIQVYLEVRQTKQVVLSLIHCLLLLPWFGFCVWSKLCDAVPSVLSSFNHIAERERELIAPL